MEIFLRGVLWLSVGFAFAIPTIHYAAKPPIHVEGRYELKPSLWSKFSLVFVWAVTLFIFYIFQLPTDAETSLKFKAVWASIFTLITVVSISSFTTRISYDNESLYIDGFVKSRKYDWSKLIRVLEYNNIASGILILKFSRRFSWVGIPADYIGFDHLEQFARQRSYK